MRRLRHPMIAMALCLSAGVAPASAANFDPVNTGLTVTQEGTARVTLNTGATISCTSGEGRVTVTSAFPDLARTSSGSNPIANSGCVSLGTFVADVVTFGTWEVTAVSTTSVNVTATPDATGRIATITVTGLGCEVTIDGPVTYTNLPWSNATTTAATGGTATFEQTVSATPPTSTENCQTTLGTTGSLDGSLLIPGASIT